MVTTLLKIFLAPVCWWVLLVSPVFGSEIYNTAYVFTFPKAMLSKSKSRACLLSQNTTYPLILTAALKKSKKMDRIEIDNDNTCFELNAPPVDGNAILQMNYLTVNIERNGERLTSELSQEYVYIYSNEVVEHLIEMDKKVYAIGDLIRIRILSLDHEMKPVDNVPFNLTILNSAGFKAIMWEQVQTTTGLVHLEYQTQDTDPQGTWILVLNEDDIIIQFEVRKVLAKEEPDFRVVLNIPKTIYFYDKTILISACGKYSNGSDVAGEVQLELMSIEPSDSFGSYTAEDRSVMHELLDGCINLEVNLDLSNGTIRDKFVDIYVTATITDSISGKNVSEYGSIHVTVVPCSLHFETINGHKRISPGLPYVGSISILNRLTTMYGMILKICYKHAPSIKEYDSCGNVEVCQEIIIGEEDSYKFTIPPLKVLSEGAVIVKASIAEVPHYSTHIKLLPVHSDSQNSIAITQTGTADCRDNLNFKITYTLNNVESGAKGIYFMLMSKFELIKSEWIPLDLEEKQSFNPSNYPNVFNGENSILAKESQFGKIIYSTELEDGGHTDLSILVYYVINGEIVADTILLHEKCLRHMAKMSEMQISITSKSCSLKFIIKTTKGSLCSVRLTEKTTSDSDEEEKYDDRIPRYDCYLSTNSSEVGTSTVLDAKAIFHESNLDIVTNQKLQTSPCIPPSESSRPKKRQEPEQPPKVTSTLLWTLALAEEDEIVLNEGCPNKKANWEFRTVCVSKEYGAIESPPMSFLLGK